MSPGSGEHGGGARQKMASFRCRRDPCGVICLILTYFSVFYADYVVIQYVLIPAYSDRSVLCVSVTFKPHRTGHGARSSALSPFNRRQTSVTASPRFLYSSLNPYRTCFFCFCFFIQQIFKLIGMHVCNVCVLKWHPLTWGFVCLLVEPFDQNSQAGVCCCCHVCKRNTETEWKAWVLLILNLYYSLQLVNINYL